jgi:hypothetical protein
MGVYCSYLAPLKCKARRTPNVPTTRRAKPTTLFYLCRAALRTCAQTGRFKLLHNGRGRRMTPGERAIVTAILCGMVLVTAFFVIGMSFPMLLPWYGR